MNYTEYTEITSYIYTTKNVNVLLNFQQTKYRLPQTVTTAWWGWRSCVSTQNVTYSVLCVDASSYNTYPDILCSSLHKQVHFPSAIFASFPHKQHGL